MPLIDPKKAAEINAAASSLGGGGNNAPIGPLLMKVQAVLAHKTKDGDPAVKMTYGDADANYRTIDEYFVIKQDGKGAEFLAKRLQVAGTDGIPTSGIETLDDLITFVKKTMLNKTYKFMIKHEESLREKDGVMYKNANARVAYMGNKDEDMQFDPSKMLKPLSAENQQIWNDYVASKNGGAPVRTATAVANVDIEDEDDDMEDVIPSAGGPAPVTKAAAKKAASAKAAPVETATTDEDIDDLDI